MKLGRRIAGYIICAVLGVVLIILGIVKTVDEFWCGMGTALVFVSAVRFIQLYRLAKNEEYREKVQTEVSDERNRFIRSKAWAVTGYLFVIASCIATIVFRVLGENELSSVTSTALCFMVGTYWISYIVISKKY